MARPTARALLALLLCACAGSGRLVVQVRTDLIPGSELASIVTTLESTEGVVVDRFEVNADQGQRWGPGVRVVDTSAASGDYRVRVAAIGRDGETLVERPVGFELEPNELQVITVVLTRDCVGVECPLEGGDPTARACLAGRCVDERCDEEHPELCEDRECEGASDCGAPSRSECVTRECTPSGACIDSLDAEVCPDGRVCTLGGCVPASGPLSPPGPGHVVLGAVDTREVFRLPLDGSSAAQSVSAVLDATWPTGDDFSASLSANGEWLAVATTRGSGAHPLVAPVRDLTRAEEVEVLAVMSSGGSTIANDGRRAVFRDDFDHLRLIERGAEAWTVSGRLTDASPYNSHLEPSLDPTETRVVFACGDVTSLGICEVALDGSGFRTILAPGFEADVSARDPRYRGDGAIVFDRRTPGNNTSAALPVGSSTPEPLRSDGTAAAHPCVLFDQRIAINSSSVVRVIAPDGALGPPLSPGVMGEAQVDGCGR